MVESKLSYEECRRQRLEENKKRMEELNLKKLSLDLQINLAPKPSPAKPRTPRQKMDMASVRRSSRVSGKPAPNYREAAMEPLKLPRRGYSYQRRDLLNRIYASDEERQYSIERAEQLQSRLDSDFPSFIKPMLQSHVTGGFWLGLPNHFCKSHLPRHDEFMTLIDEDGNESETKYLSEKNGLSAGWRGFAIDHELVDGDALVFQLTTSTEFKVYIIRAYNSEDKNEEDNDEDGDVDVEEEDEDVSPPTGKSSKRSKRNSVDKNEDDKEEDVDVAATGRRSKRIKQKNKNEEDEDDEEDEDVAPTGRRSKRNKTSKK